MGKKFWTESEAWRVSVLATNRSLVSTGTARPIGTLLFEDHPFDENAARALFERLERKHWQNAQRVVVLEHRPAGCGRYRVLEPTP